MTYFEYLKTKTKFLVIWFIIHGLALFVNIFNIDGEIYSKANKPLFGATRSTVFKIKLFTDHKNTYNDDFWPFVDFFYEKNWKGFKGLFYNYGIPEFIAYTALIFIFCYFRHESKKRLS